MLRGCSLRCMIVAQLNELDRGISHELRTMHEEENEVCNFNFESVLEPPHNYEWQDVTDRRWPRLFQGPKLPSEWRCRHQWRDPDECCQRPAFRSGLRQAVGQFRRRKLAVIQRRMLRQLVSLAPRRLLLRDSQESVLPMKRAALIFALGGVASRDGDELKFTRVPTEWSHSLEVHLRG